MISTEISRTGPYLVIMSKKCDRKFKIEPEYPQGKLFQRMKKKGTVFYGGYCVIVLDCWPVSRFNFKEWLYCANCGMVCD